MSLKMLGLYLYTLKIGHKFCNVLSTLNLLTLQKELHHVVTNNVFWDKNVKTRHRIPRGDSAQYINPWDN